MNNTFKKYGIISALIIVAVTGAIFFMNPDKSNNMVDSTVTEIIDLNDGDSYTITATEVTKEINGKKERMLAYNGSIPGPTLRVKQGATAKILFVNNTAIDNTIHAHGVRMNNQFDGVPGVTQTIVKKGESFEYTLNFPDAGVFWYHPHNRDDFTIEHGLYGAIVVSPTGEHSWNTVSREETIFIDDILLSRSGIDQFKKEYTSYALMGRFGNVPFLNGETQFATTAKKGEIVRYYLINSANTRPFNIAFNGARMKLVGGDNGLYERDSFVDSVVLHPSERAIIEVLFENAGNHNIVNLGSRALMRLGTVSVADDDKQSDAAGDTFMRTTAHPEVTKSISLIREYAQAQPDKRITLTLTMGGNGMSSGMGHGAMMNDAASEDGIEWDDTMPMMNEMSDQRMVQWKMVDEDTGNENMDIDWDFKRGVPVKIRITNDSQSAHPMQHPIHFHGVRFAIVSRNGIAQENLVWKDTVAIPAGEYADIVMIPEEAGSWMAHCHILEHIESGMMLSFNVQ